MTKSQILDLVATYKSGGKIQEWASKNGMTYQNAMLTIKKLREAGVEIPNRRPAISFAEAVKELTK